MVFGKVFSPKSIIINLESEEKDELLEEMAQAVFSVHPEINKADALCAVREREAKMTTGIKQGIAVPHGIFPSMRGCAGAIGISRKGIDYDSLDGKPVHIVFMFLCGSLDNELHLAVLRDLAVVLQDDGFAAELMKKESGQEVYDFLCKFED